MYCGEQIEERLPVEEIRWPRNIYIGCYFKSNVVLRWMLRVNGERLKYFSMFGLRRWKKRSLQPQSSKIFHLPQLLSVHVYTGHMCTSCNMTCCGGSRPTNDWIHTMSSTPRCQASQMMYWKWSGVDAAQHDLVQRPNAVVPLMFSVLWLPWCKRLL